MTSYIKQTSPDKPTTEVLKTSYNVQIFKNIIQLPNGLWQFDKDVYSTAEYSVIEQNEKKALLETITRLKEENASLILEVDTLKEKVTTSELTIDSLLTDIIPSLTV